MADDNRPLKYMRYAIGEIVLVVVGILIALQINNWNENNKSDVIRKDYYYQLLDDLEIDKNEMTSIIDQIESRKKKYDSYIKTFEAPGLGPIELIENISKLDYVFRFYSFETSTMESLLNTGDIKLLPNLLRRKLIRFNRSKQTEIERTTLNYIEYRDKLRQAELSGFSDLYDRSLQHEDLLALLYPSNSNQLKEVIYSVDAAIRIKNMTETVSLSVLKELLVEIEIIDELINKELEEN